jgi:hypothetical protein
VNQAGAQRETPPRDSTAFIETSFAYYDVLRRSSNIQTLSLSAQDYSIHGGFPLAGGVLGFTGQRITADFQNSNSQSTLDISLSSKIQRWAMTYERTIGNFNIALGADFLDEFQHVLLFGNGSIEMKFPLAFVSGIRLGVREYSVPLFFRTTYLDSELPLSHALHQTDIEASVELSLIPKNLLQLNYMTSGNVPKGETNLFDGRDKSESEGWSASLFQDVQPWRYEMSYDLQRFRSTFDFLHGGTMFGDASLSDALIERVGAGCRLSSAAGSDILFDGSFTTLKGSFVGNLQSWPFLSILQSAITNRINFRFIGSVKYWQIGAEKLLQFESVTLKPRITYYDVRPDIVIQSWQPEFLVIGISHFADNTLDIIHAGLAQLELTVGFHTPIIVAELSGTQFLPIFQYHRAVQGGVGPAPTPSPDHGEVTTNGGRWARLTVRKYL